jgi:hypothetical protein
MGFGKLVDKDIDTEIKFLITGASSYFADVIGLDTMSLSEFCLSLTLCPKPSKPNTYPAFPVFDPSHLQSSTHHPYL